MPASGRPWRTMRQQLLNDARRNNDPCWICREPIDYDAEPRTPRSFTADHTEPTSLGGDAVRYANLRPAHYQRVQLETRQHHSRTLPELETVVTRTPWPPDLRGVHPVDLRGADPSIPGPEMMGPRVVLELG